MDCAAGRTFDPVTLTGLMDVAVATTNQLAADAAGAMVELGGNAVDAAIAAALMTMVNEPGVCAPGGGGYVTIAPTDEPPVTIDGNVEMPGRGADPARLGVPGRVAEMDYGGGVITTVGYGSVATPGAYAALALALERWGTVPWRVALEPTIDAVRAGFPLSAASRYYLEYSHLSVFGWHADSFVAIHDDSGTLLPEGALVSIPALATSLEELATRGVASFYTGELAASIAADFDEHGGILTRNDLSSYRPIVRPAAELRLGAWTVATNPPPAIGGVTLLAMLAGLDLGTHPVSGEKLVRQQVWARQHRLDIERTGSYEDGTTALLRLLAEADPAAARAPSTVHTSAVDANGLGCAVTLSAGYGSGLMPGGTGMWMNNALGEVELNPGGFHALRTGARLGSNMAPTVATSDQGDVLAIGSPGADRITSALQQTLARVMGGDPIRRAVDAPRLHVELVDEEIRVAAEPGADLSGVNYPVRGFPSADMFFGGVAAAMSSGGVLQAAADPRRTGGVFVGS